MKRVFFLISTLLIICSTSLKAQIFKLDEGQKIAFVPKEQYVSAAQQMDNYLPLLKGKRSALSATRPALWEPRISLTH